MRIRSRIQTALEIQPGQDIEVLGTSKAYFEVKVRPIDGDDTLILVESVHGDSTVIGASTAVYLLEEIA
jgi:hypothetical protein